MKLITSGDFKKHVDETFKQYVKSTRSVNLKEFNKNMVDPFKLLFDNAIAGDDWEKVISNEIFRQTDKTKNNLIGYFHQNLFKYIDDCVVPKEDVDIIYKDKIFVELKNKHNTMNSSSSRAIWEKMERALKEGRAEQYFLVEVITKKSQNIPWKNEERVNENIRRVSYDVFLSMVTGVEDAFEQILKELQKILNGWKNTLENDGDNDSTVIEELKELNDDIFESLKMLTFKDYIDKLK